MGEGPFDILAAQALHRLGLTERCLARANDPGCLLQEQVALIARSAWNLDQFFATSLYERMRYQPDRAKAFEVEQTCGFRVILGDVRPVSFVPVHLELETTASPLLERMLSTTLTLGSAEIRRVCGPVQLSDLAALEPKAYAEAHAGQPQDVQRLSG